MPFTKYLKEHSFTPEAVKAMSEALTRVCRELEDAGIRYSTATVVQMITAVASTEDLDAERLSFAVVQSFLNSKGPRTERVAHAG